jgi:hypothetical protein
LKEINFFVVGAQKSGTTYLHSLLESDKGIFLPEIKETHFFNNGHNEFDKGVKFYLEKYYGGCASASTCGEVDPEYMYFSKVPKRIYENFPNAKLIFIFRDPVQRAFSHYLMTYRRGLEKQSFEEAIDLESDRIATGCMIDQSKYSYVTRGLYCEQVKRYLKYFSKEQMVFLRADSLYSNPEKCLLEIYKLLNLSPETITKCFIGERNLGGLPINMPIQRFMSSSSRIKSIIKMILPRKVRTDFRKFLELKNRKQRSYPQAKPETLEKLRRFYRTDLEELTSITNIEVTDWL